MIEDWRLSCSAQPLWQGASMPEGAAHDPSGFVADLGKGLFAKTRSVAILERIDGAEWHEVARFGNTQDANHAVDDAIAKGAKLGSLRVVQSYAVSSRALLIAGGIALAAAIAIVLYIVVGFRFQLGGAPCC
jgi:hypothetical protein